ncbi:hypothetical protein [Nonomuraea phyllanthi]|nr:hypothetical protein [Nonomuraea phyllanthi]
MARSSSGLRSIGGQPPTRPDRPAVGLDPEVEARLLRQARG